METSGHPEFFAALVKEHRRGRPMAEMPSLGGPGVPTWVKAENKRLGANPRKDTFAKFDRALGWAPGSAARAFWHGEQPVALDRGPRAVSPLRATADSVNVPLEQVEDLLNVQRDFHAALGSASGAVPIEELRPLSKSLDDVVSIIVGRWATDMLEANRSGGAAHPGLAVALADALSVPVDEKDPNAEDRLYRRWLAGGRFAEGLDDARRERFQNRFDTREGGENDGR
ncbi:hypothetical protein ACWDO0_28270 [Nocardia rhamnosiphila]